MKVVVMLALVALALMFGASAWQLARGDAGEKIVMPNLFTAPDITSATWLNTAPLSANDLRGKVVVVEFWTFG
ncbi:MAG: hypothetical protein HZC40_22280 [Chloroflexi bacterium]|nr:hypothetical protein [Chloroflexota bacterium]